MERAVIKIVDCIHYHLWTDALHGRELARQAKNDWDRGTYVRWTIQTAWTAFEAVCGDTLGITGLGMRFREKFDEEIEKKGLPALDWGQGLWQQVLVVYGVRKEFIHVKPSATQGRLMTPLPEAEKAITILRQAIYAVCDLVKAPHPPWAADDHDPGFETGRGSWASPTLSREGAREDDPAVIRITYFHRGDEHVDGLFPPGTKHGPLLDDLLKRLNVPVKAIRAYRGRDLIEEREIKARGG